MFCPKCGSKMNDSAKFCPKCGMSISAEEMKAGKIGGIRILIILVFLLAALVLSAVVIFTVKNGGKTDGSARSERHLDDDDDDDDDENDDDGEPAGNHSYYSMNGGFDDNGWVNPGMGGNVNHAPLVEEAAPEAEAPAAEEAAPAAEEAAPEAEAPAAEEATPAAEITEYDEIHDYEIIVKDVDWNDADNDCNQRGGHLLRINGEDEYEFIKDMISDAGRENCVFMLGGQYNYATGHYQWYHEGYYGSALLDEDYPFRNYWLDGEPSFEGRDKDGKLIEEHYIDMFYNNKKGGFVWNDVPEDLTEYYPGRVAYICEYE